MSDTETKVLTSTVADSSGMSPRPNLKAELVERPASPEINCAICLEELRNKSYTNTCLHQFCFHCLLEWSKVKPECPLCKQGFSRIYHNIRSNQEYDEHVLEPAMPPPPLDPHIFINVAFQRHRFRYRSTVGGGSMMWAFQGLNPMSMSTSWPANPLEYLVPSAPTSRPVRQGATNTRSSTRNQRQDASAFRRNVYRQGLWVRPGNAARFRECSPEFYRLNPAQTHRLVPWLTRELTVLLDMQYDTHTVCQDILNLISAHHINSSVFHRAMTFYLGSTAEHFIHEFYHFAISPHDMNAYDANVQYAQVGREFSSESDSDMEVLNLPEPLVSLDLTAAPGPSGLQSQSASAAIDQNRATTTAGSSSSNYIVIELSDDDEPQAIDNDPDSDVEIIGQVPPRHLRTPEVITIETDSDDVEIESSSVEPKREPLVHYNVISSGEEDADEDVVRLTQTEENTYNTPVYQTALPCNCPIYDNCPYSREVMLQNSRRNLFKRESLISSTSFSCSSNSSVSHSTDVDDIADSSNIRSGSSKPSKAKSPSTTSNNKKKCTKSNRQKRGTKRPRSDDGASRSGRTKRTVASSPSTDNRRIDSPVSNNIVEESGTSFSEDSCSSNSTTSTNSSTSSSTSSTSSNMSSSTSSEDQRIDWKIRRPGRLKSIVLKVDRSSNSSCTSSVAASSPRYSSRRHHSRRISSSETDD